MAVLLCTSVLSVTSGVDISTSVKIDSMDEAKNYAYMDLDSAPENMKEIIRESREYIISQSEGWVSDGWKGAIVNMETGEVVEEVPQFHDIFPDDWEVPTDESVKKNDSDKKKEYPVPEQYKGLPEANSKLANEDLVDQPCEQVSRMVTE